MGTLGAGIVFDMSRTSLVAAAVFCAFSATACGDAALASRGGPQGEVLETFLRALAAADGEAARACLDTSTSPGADFGRIVVRGLALAARARSFEGQARARVPGAEAVWIADIDLAAMVRDLRVDLETGEWKQTAAEASLTVPGRAPLRFVQQGGVWRIAAPNLDGNRADLVAKVDASLGVIEAFYARAEAALAQGHAGTKLRDEVREAARVTKEQIAALYPDLVRIFSER